MDAPVRQPRPEPGTTRVVARWLLRETLGVLLLAVLLFGAAGRTDWLLGWALVAITGGWVAGTALVVIPRHPDLLAERLRPKRGSKGWDTAILSVIGLLTLAGYVVAGLDARYRWRTGMALAPAAWGEVGALVAVVLGYALLVWATGANAFFAQTVRVQTERGHTVVTAGPYRLVRHPGYAGSLLQVLATPVLLGSGWALIPFGLVALLTVARTALEDRTLRAELAGYEEYTRQVRYRLLPGVW